MKKILILEGSETFASELKDYFTAQKDYEVCGVTGDGAEGLELLESQSPSIAIIDLLLKNKDGFEVLEGVKKLGRKTDVIVLGNFMDDIIVGQAMELGARYYFMKPVSAKLVGERTLMLCDGSHWKNA